ncbi:hypothetical protein SAMN02745784_02739 [Tissierella praeacuta DSM 18095]|uniref:Uncharacterized protein n=1 Tax=Tissierella praeacuta DSM 18095 TaxID=1123404 RepID=A0A1M4YQ08_9FIRM|nr:hypothetical protein [Tissierella praeacuta]SHF07884.1 hypothetical protein SAMN02745784_02739 [Tissierella praeacuta DSM 18095]SUP02423.1 Uncharacterised protein [Tissierella praeacuta]
MKIIKESSNKNIIIPLEVLKESKILDSRDLELKTVENGFVVLKGTMNAMELIKLAEGLKNLSEDLITHLAGAYGRCDDCSYCKEYDEFDEIIVPEYLLEEAGIPTDAKLCAYTEEDSGEIVVIESDHNYDLADVPQFVIDIFEISGVCIRELEENLIMENIVYGDE